MTDQMALQYNLMGTARADTIQKRAFAKTGLCSYLQQAIMTHYNRGGPLERLTPEAARTSIGEFLKQAFTRLRHE